MSQAWCVGCWMAVTFQRELPKICTVCGGSKFRPIATLVDEPKKPYRLSENDRQLLKSLRIAAEV